MLTHHLPEPTLPPRTVILGAGGFVGGVTRRRLEGLGGAVLPLTRTDVDLMAADAAEILAAQLRPDDVLLFAAAKAPVKNTEMLAENITMLQTVIGALRKQPVSYVLNIGSDAIYADSDGPLTESSVAQPGSLHGVMHLAREVALDQDQPCPFATLRPTLIFGPQDPHNGYGPNRFMRLAKKGEELTLFGEGEERRDHVYVEDVGALAAGMILQRSTGALNAATGRVLSFREIAEKIVTACGSNSAITGTPRSGPMPHNGYRPFDPSATPAAFPDFRYTAFEDALEDLKSIDA